MTIAEKIYSAVVVLYLGFLCLSLASFHFVIIPRVDNPGVIYFFVSVIWMMTLAIAATTIANLYYRSLLVVPTIVQCVVLCIWVYLIPIGIWGGLLLYWRIQREKAAQRAALGAK